MNLLISLSITLGVILITGCNINAYKDSRTKDVTDKQSNSTINKKKVANKTNVYRNLKGIINHLNYSDIRWKPKKIIMSNGSLGYEYLKYKGEELSIREINRRMNSPRMFSRQQQDIIKLVKKLHSIGVDTILVKVKSGALGTWRPVEKKVTLSPLLISHGTLAFHEILTHESIHVSQSCFAGSPNAKPTPIGLRMKYDDDINRALSHPNYHKESKKSILVEREAFSNSRIPGKALWLLSKYCSKFSITRTNSY